MDEYLNGWKPWDTTQGGYWVGGTHWSEVVANNGIDFIEQAIADDQPFFMYIAFNATHDPRQSPKEYIDMYPLDSIEVPEDFMENYPYDEEIGCDPTKLRDERLMPSPRTEFAVKVHRQEYFAIATHMDAQIGRIIDALEKSGKADNTYIIFTADHGLSVGHHGLVGKQSMYDHSMRVPFFISGPGIQANQSFDMPIYLQDAMATTLDLAQIEKPSYVEFNSVVPLIRGEKTVQYDFIYGKYMNFQRMIQKGDYKLIMYPYAKVSLLFNLAKDPLEMNDLASNPEYASKLAELKMNFIGLQKTMGDDLDVDHPPVLRQKRNMDSAH
jgi:arylsulfatase A-like enzyme